MPQEVPNFRHLRAYCAVAERRSVSRAADQVHLSQPAITQAISKLEKRLGVPLFERRSNGMYPTEPGSVFHERARRVLGLLETGAKEFARIDVRKGARGFSNFDHLVTVAQMRALCAISRTGNFSLAARSVGISQPSIHRAARDLERLAGAPLFVTRSEGIELTRGAQALAQHAKLAFAELKQGLAEIAEWLGQDTGRIVIGSMPLARTRILPEALNNLTRSRPNVSVRVVDGPYGDLLHGLRHGELDLLIGALRNPPPIGDVNEILLFEDALAIAARAGHPLARKKRIAGADLLGFPWVVPPEGAPTRTFFNSMFAARELANLPGLIETSSLAMVRGLLCGSDRLTIISAHQIMHEQRQGLLVQLPLNLPGSVRQIGLTVRRGWRPTATQKELLGHLRRASPSIEQ
ncbi:MAG: LysR family transcriptional regulator [Hyphomicrobiaceae bacterium]|nr:MAG: LysR family transcriptional regulator [Hyphomicrobiaceae bacterium]